ncbi:MAG TPA: lipid II flippase MurJ [Acidimicrobiales bacterium]|nr:lipid II flippase MurJ [Acidimicrobiales bacterium]
MSLGGPRGQVTAGNLAARITGLLRVIAVGGALGTTYLGNTYQSANLVSNLLFELLAAGILSSVLVPPFVALLDEGRREDAERLAGAVLGLALAVLGAVTLAGLLARPWIMRALTVAVADEAVREAQVRLGGFLLWLFVPQVLFYAVSSVATAVLHGSRRFAAAAFAPVANNVVVIATMVVFRVLAGGDGGLDLPLSHRLVLAGGTTAGVAAMAAVPLLALRRAGVRLRPRWEPSHPALRSLGRAGIWGVVYLTMSQLLVAVTLVLANRVEGGVVAYHIAFTTFLLPFAILAHPVLTTVYPGLAAEAQAGRWSAFADALGRSVRSVAFLVLPAAALLVALARPGLRLIQVGALDDAGGRLVAGALAGYALGLVGYAGLHLLTRASYAAADTRSPAVVNVGVAVVGSLLMVVLTTVVSESGRMVAIGVAHSVAMVAGAVALGVAVRRRVGVAWPVGGTLARSLAGALAAGVAARVVADMVAVDGRLGAALAVASGAAAGVGAYLLSAWALRAPELRLRRVPAVEPVS